MYSISIILLLKNNSTNICSEISKIEMNLWMVYIILAMGYSRKKPNRGGGGLRIWNFQGYQRNSICNFQELIKNRGEISTDDQEKIMWNFQGSCFLALKFPRDVTQFCGISRVGALLCLEFPGLK